MAFDLGYEEFSKKAESFEICFVPDNDYRSFLKHRVDGLEEKVKGGNFVDKNGKVLGQHAGYPFYTIGQRKGLGKAFGYPAFVTKIIPETNTVVIGHVDDLLKNSMKVGGINPMKYATIPEGMESKTMIRYNDGGVMSTLHNLPSGEVEVNFLANVRGVAPGQSAVFYEGDDLIGGGIIARTEPFKLPEIFKTSKQMTT